MSPKAKKPSEEAAAGEKAPRKARRPRTPAAQVPASEALAPPSSDDSRERHAFEVEALKAEFAVLAAKAAESDALRARLAGLEQSAAEKNAKTLRRDGELLESAGQRIRQLENALAELNDRSVSLQQLVAEAEERSHERELTCAALTSDLAAAGGRILELEAALQAANERIALYEEAAAEAGRELVELEERLGNTAPVSAGGAAR